MQVGILLIMLVFSAKYLINMQLVFVRNKKRQMLQHLRMLMVVMRVNK